MELLVFNGKNNWIDLPEIKGKIKVDYMTIEQQKEIDKLQFELTKIEADLLKANGIVIRGLKPKEIADKIIDLVDNDPKIIYDFNSITDLIKLSYIKYGIKDWQGFSCDGEPLELQLEQVGDGTEIKSYLMNSIRQNKQLVDILFNSVMDKTRFDEVDKKKSKSAQYSKKKV